MEAETVGTETSLGRVREAGEVEDSANRGGETVVIHLDVKHMKRGVGRIQTGHQTKTAADAKSGNQIVQVVAAAGRERCVRQKRGVRTFNHPGLAAAAASCLGKAEQLPGDIRMAVARNGESCREEEFVAQAVSRAQQIGFEARREVGVLLRKLSIEGSFIHVVVEESVGLVAFGEQKVAKTDIAEHFGAGVAGHRDGDIEVCLRSKGRVELAAKKRCFEEVTAAERLSRNERREGEQCEQDGQTVSFHCASSFWRER